MVELKDIQLTVTMKRAMARQAEAEREKRAKIINAEGKSLAAAALGEASDIMMAHPLALQLRNLQSLVEIGVDKNTTVVFPAPLMSTIAELGTFLARERQRPARHRPDGSNPAARRTANGRPSAAHRRPGPPPGHRSDPRRPLPSRRPAMRRRTFDILMAIAGLFLAVTLTVSGGLRFWAHNFIGNEVHTQLAAQQIFFPAARQPCGRHARVRGHAAVRRAAAHHRRSGQGLRRPLHRQSPQGGGRR